MFLFIGSKVFKVELSSHSTRHLSSLSSSQLVTENSDILNIHRDGFLEKLNVLSETNDFRAKIVQVSSHHRKVLIDGIELGETPFIGAVSTSQNDLDETLHRVDSCSGIFKSLDGAFECIDPTVSFGHMARRIILAEPLFVTTGCIGIHGHTKNERCDVEEACNLRCLDAPHILKKECALRVVHIFGKKITLIKTLCRKCDDYFAMSDNDVESDDSSCEEGCKACEFRANQSQLTPTMDPEDQIILATMPPEEKAMFDEKFKTKSWKCLCQNALQCWLMHGFLYYHSGRYQYDGGCERTCSECPNKYTLFHGWLSEYMIGEHASLVLSFISGQVIRFSYDMAYGFERTTIYEKVLDFRHESSECTNHDPFPWHTSRVFYSYIPPGWQPLRDAKADYEDSLCPCDYKMRDVSRNEHRVRRLRHRGRWVRRQVIFTGLWRSLAGRERGPAPVFGFRDLNADEFAVIPKRAKYNE